MINVIVMGLDGPSRRIVVEPLRTAPPPQPQPLRERPEPRRAPARVPPPEREKVPAR